MDYQQIHKTLVKQFRWRYFVPLDYEEIRDCCSDAIETFIKIAQAGWVIENPEGWLYKVTKRKIERLIANKKRKAQQDLTNENILVTTIEEFSGIEILAAQDWTYKGEEKVHIGTNGKIVIQINSSLSNDLYAYFQKYLHGRCLEIFLLMLARWEDEDIQIEFEYGSIETFRQTRYRCMKDLREKLKVGGEWNLLFD